MKKGLLTAACLFLIVPAVAYAQPGPPNNDGRNGERGESHRKPPAADNKAPEANGPPNGGPPPKDGQGPGHAPPDGKQPGDHLDHADGGTPPGPPPGHAQDAGVRRRPPRGHSGPDRATEITEARKDLPTARKKAKDEARDEARKRYAGAQDETSRNKLRGAMTTNAQRMARLARLREIANKKKDTASVTRIDALITKEEHRHTRWLNTHAPSQ